MVGLNRIQLIGKLGRTPELKETPSGKTICVFSMAVNRRWRDADGETQEATDWFNVEAWGRIVRLPAGETSLGNQAVRESEQSRSASLNDGIAVPQRIGIVMEL
ncbi:MAG: single-stranded DNA-binding protein [Anaerolineales bacterium]